MKFLDICSQVSIVYTVYNASFEEKEWQLGGDTLTASLEQTAIMHMAIKQISICFECLGWEFISQKTWMALAFSPLLVGAVNTYAPIESTEWQERISTLTFNLGNVGRVVVIVATVALSIIGRDEYVVVALGTCGVSWLRNHDQMPEDAKLAIHFGVYLLMSVAGVYQSEDPLERFFSALNLLGMGEYYFGPYLYGEYGEKEVVDQSGITFDAFRLVPAEDWVINPAHFKHKSPLYGEIPPSYEAFAATLDQWTLACDSIDWSLHTEAILMKLTCDDHWTNPEYVKGEVRTLYAEYLKGDKSLKELESFAIQYFKEGLHILAYRMKKRAAAFAQVSCKLPEVLLNVRRTYSEDIGSVSKEGFSDMQRLIAPITELITRSPDSEESIGTLIQLGIDGASFCGTRLSDLFDAIGKQLFEKNLDAPTIAHTILREKQMTYIYDLMEKETGKYPTFWRRLVGEHTPHRRNLYVKFYGEPLGFDMELTKNDDTTPSYAAGDRLFWLPWVRSAKREFQTEYYTQEHLIEWIQDQAKSHHRLSWEKMEAWFQKQGVQSAEVCDVLSGEIQEEAIRFFLVKLGVLGTRP
jgi:hypothetical protein